MFKLKKKLFNAFTHALISVTSKRMLYVQFRPEISKVEKFNDLAKEVVIIILIALHLRAKSPRDRWSGKENDH
jgi:hypothetical protein